jgi:hypothetical protein
MVKTLEGFIKNTSSLDFYSTFECFNHNYNFK